ncbi:Plus-end-directed kinesin ATPase protein [Dioscorea alata]|uniref:Plus-end-directed kinesin ATPase protein n=1 Tax=Dioscorea alata TaxID=55571 RepID=A0ACB7W4Q3_DIOAL|nr:Plus-end-directed kinesin ATPase protein [Dioscorea alata]
MINAAAAGGRHMQHRSGHSPHHQRQCSSNQFLHFDSVSGAGDNKWLKNAQTMEYSRMLRSMQKEEFFSSSSEASTPLESRPSSGQRRNGGDVSPNVLCSGILDLHSFDIELLPEHILDFHGNFDDSDARFSLKCARDHLNKKEISRKEEDIINIKPHLNSLTVNETKLRVDLTEYLEKHEFVFDAALDEDISNDEVYRETVEPIVLAFFWRTKATCSGKTYTMQRLPLKGSQDLLRLMYHTRQNQGFQLFVSFFEIYGGKLFDLLNDGRKLCKREDGKQQVCIVGLQEYRVSNFDTIRELIEKGNATRSTGTTGANEEFVDGSESKPSRIIGKLSFIDLAGSERGADTTDNDKQTRIEGAEINKSSKLTEVLRDSFLGDSWTVMISCISPNSGSSFRLCLSFLYFGMVKSLSKGNNTEKDPFVNSSIRESTTLPFYSSLPTVCSYDGNNNAEVAAETNRYGLSKQVDKEISLLFNTDRVPKEAYGQSKPLLKGKVDTYSAPSSEDIGRRVYHQPKQKDVLDIDTDSFYSYEDLNGLWNNDEEVLVIAHRRQVEETIDIEEMKLLQKVATIVNLQARLAHFQRSLMEHNVLSLLLDLDA